MGLRHLYQGSVGDSKHWITDIQLFIRGHWPHCLYHITCPLIVHTRHLFVCLYQWWSLITPVSLGWWALGWPEHSCRAITAALSGGLPGCASPRWRFCLQLAGGPNLYNRGRQVLTSDSGCFWNGGIYGDVGIRALGVRQQRVYNSRSRPWSSPSLSFWTSYLRPSRPSWEGFGVGLQVRGWGDA